MPIFITFKNKDFAFLYFVVLPFTIPTEMLSVWHFFAQKHFTHCVLRSKHSLDELYFTQVFFAI